MQTDAFASEAIDQILNNRTEKRQIGGRAGNNFSVATFTVNQGQVRTSLHSSSFKSDMAVTLCNPQTPRVKMSKCLNLGGACF
jgi:hypothetical protein